MKLAIFILVLSFALVGACSTTKHYIVYMGDHSLPNSNAVVSENHALLAKVTGSFERAHQAVVHHYSKSFRGFSAMLTLEQAQQLSGSDGVVSVFESKISPLHTTHSWNFLGLNKAGYSHIVENLITDSKDDVIVGLIDSGVWPESRSFDDTGLGPVPERFKGECVEGESFSLANCNRKIIGARFYSKGFEAEMGPLESFGEIFFRSARDSDGHGSHTASTAVGSVASNVSLLGIATGTARGGASGARLAIYKACWFSYCSDADVLSAFEDAITDGVDIISMSLGPEPPQQSFFEDSNSIGAFHAFRNGILVSAAAGNSGLASTATNVAPWILTVAASSIDRKLQSNVYLGNSKVIKGESLNTLELKGYFGIISASSAAAPGVPATNASFCKKNTLDPTLIKGKIVVCTIEVVRDNRTEKSVLVKEGGGVGMILVDPIFKDVGFQYVIPAATIGLHEAKELQTYLATDMNPTANIGRAITILNDKPAPKVAAFSSRGPNVVTPDIIKPDITAPGVNILAAWSPIHLIPPGLRSVDFNIISGTSMSCPHVSGAAALIKSCHPSWSPAAIKSALMTTATGLDNTNRRIVADPDGSAANPFDLGSGHLNPVAALDPGLVYDFDSDDIINFLCGNGASPVQLQNLTSNLTTCKTPIAPYNLNYASIGMANMTGSVSIYRTLTNYGRHGSIYVAHIESPPAVNVKLTPRRLKFTKSGEKLSFRLDFVPVRASNGSFVFGAITWRDGAHVVRSPIALNVVSI